MRIDYIIEPLMGAIIGLITNSLAIRMLFRPYEAKYIGRFRIPFTPGLIPKEKERIAKAIGEVIAQYLLDDVTITNAICSDEVKSKAQNTFHKYIEKISVVDKTLSEYLEDKGIMNACNIAEAYVSSSFSDYVVRECVESDMVDGVVNSALDSVVKNLNPLVAMMAKNAIEDSRTEIIEKVKTTAKEKGPGVISGYIDSRYIGIMDKKMSEIAVMAQSREKEIVEMVWSKYTDFIKNKSASMLRFLNLKQIVEDKINSYNLRDLEMMINSIAKKELNALVYLGGLLGFLMGLVNILF